jgi:hypothetical protein
VVVREKKKKVMTRSQIKQREFFYTAT